MFTPPLSLRCLAAGALVWVTLATTGCEPETSIVAPLRTRGVLAPENAQKPLEPSGLVLFQDRLMMVSDERDIADVYELTEAGRDLRARPFLSFSPVPTFRGSDLEGITFCGERFYLVDEYTDAIGELDLQGNLTVHPLDWRFIDQEMRAFPLDRNTPAGLEGIACDSSPGLLYLARERQPRMIYVVSLPDFKVQDAFDVHPGWESPRTEAGILVYADYSDLYFDGGFLYALQRSDRAIVKIATKEKRLVSKLQLDFEESRYYDYAGPFGFAEGLQLTKDRIYIILDNNGVSRRENPRNIAPLVLEFVRPDGF